MSIVAARGASASLTPMFDWLWRRLVRRKAERPGLPPLPPPFFDDVLGELRCDREKDGWIVPVAGSSAQPAWIIVVGGDDVPDAKLLEHARELAAAPEPLVSRTRALLEDFLLQHPEYGDEVRGLRISEVHLLWPDQPDDGIIYFDGPDVDERLWQCDYVGRMPRGVGFDD